jgi:hypothetical protein
MDPRVIGLYREMLGTVEQAEGLLDQICQMAEQVPCQRTSLRIRAAAGQTASAVQGLWLDLLDEAEGAGLPPALDPDELPPPF